MNTVQNLNKKLKLAILGKFGSQREFAKTVNIHEVDLSNIIRGRKKPTDEQVVVISGALGRDAVGLFGKGCLG